MENVAFGKQVLLVTQEFKSMLFQKSKSLNILIKTATANIFSFEMVNYGGVVEELDSFEDM